MSNVGPLWCCPRAHEMPQHVRELPRGREYRQVSPAFEGVELGPGNTLGDVLRRSERDAAVGCSVGDQGRHLNLGEQRLYVSFGIIIEQG